MRSLTRRSVFPGGCPDRGAETGDRSSVDLLLLSASRPWSFAAVPVAWGEGAGPWAQALRGPPSACSRPPSACGWQAGPAAPAQLAPTVPLALPVFSGLGRFELASTPQIPCNLSPRGSLPTHCANAFLSLSSLPLSLRTHALRLPGLATAPARPTSSCLVSQARIDLAVLLVPLNSQSS